MQAKISKAGGAKLWVTLPDIHFPDHDPAAVEIVKKAINILKPDNTLLLGDVLDCGVFSNFKSKAFLSEAKHSFEKEEVIPCNNLLDYIQENTKEKTFFLEGNHEARVERWAVNSGLVGKEIFGIISPQKLLSQGRKNFKYILYENTLDKRMGYVQIAPSHQSMRTGGLVAIHGWSWAKNAARVHLEKSRSQSVIYGHTHRIQLETSRDPWKGNPIIAFSPGTLSKLQPLYATGGSPSEWSHGFALIYVGRTSWTQYIIPITKGCCVLPDGREIKI